MGRWSSVLSAVLAAGLLAAPGAAPPASASPVGSPVGSLSADTPVAKAAFARKVIGQSVRGRDIVAYHLGEPGRPDVPKVVLISTMHGNEPAPLQILTALRDGPEVVGIDLWVVPSYNPDGLAAGSRKNANGVDLNRNFPYEWADLDGTYESGPKPASEPETQAMMGFLRQVRPDRILSFHQPLNGVDTDTKDPAFARRVARRLDLPTTTLDCGGVCHGTMTAWFNHGFAGTALTVEYGAHPGRRRMRDVAPGQVLSVFGARRADLGYEPLPVPPPSPAEPNGLRPTVRP